MRSKMIGIKPGTSKAVNIIKDGEIIAKVYISSTGDTVVVSANDEYKLQVK